MSIKKALDILREPIRPTTDAIRMIRLERIIREADDELEAVQESKGKSKQLPNPLQIEFGTGRVLVSQFIDDNGAGIMFRDVKEPHEIGAKGPEEQNPHKPESGEVYLYFKNIEGLRVVEDALKETRKVLSPRDELEAEEKAQSKPEPGGCKHSMNDLMAKAGIESPCPICMQNIIDSQAEQLKKYKQMATKAIGGPVDEFELLLSSERAARETICNLQKQLAAQAEEIERLTPKPLLFGDLYSFRVAINDKVPRGQIWFASQEQIDEALEYSAQQIEQTLKVKEGTEDGSRPDTTEKI